MARKEVSMKTETAIFWRKVYAAGEEDVGGTQKQAVGRKRSMGKKKREQERGNDIMLNLPG